LIKCCSCGQIKDESEFRHNPTAVYHRCTQCARANRLKGNIKSRLTETDKQYIIEAYNLGLFNGRLLASLYGVSDTTIYKTLKTGRTKKIRDRNRRIRREFTNGISIKELSEKYDLNPEWVVRMQFSIYNYFNGGNKNV
jgi:Mor family transcriptional regulator